MTSFLQQDDNPITLHRAEISKPFVTLLVFSWNEIDGMREIMPKIPTDFVDRILIVDGGSTDGTIEYAKANGYELFVQKERGMGAAFLEAMERIAGDIVIVFSPDGNSIPERIPDLIKKIGEGYDMVIVSRYRDGAKSHDDDIVTAFGNRFFTGLINLLFAGQVTDGLVMYRAYKTALIRDAQVDTKENPWGSQILCRALKMGRRVGEIPGDEPARIGGERKMKVIQFGLAELKAILKEFLVPR